MENYFYYSIPSSTRNFYGEGDNLEIYKQLNPDVYEAMSRLADILQMDVV
jgi:hypothetical protein